MASIAVIGGGVVGCAAAAWLIADGHTVTVFERAIDERPASGGNAGLIALPEITPLARPGILGSVPGWLLDPLGPLSLRPRDLPRLLPFLMRFVSASRAQHVEESTSALAALMGSALVDHQELARRAGLSGHMQRTGALHIIDGPAAYQTARNEWTERRRHGVEVNEIAPEAARRLVPALAGRFTNAVFVPDYWMVSSPAAILEALRLRVAAAGTLSRSDVVTIHRDEREVSVITAEGGDLPFDRVVVTAGVWSRDLVRDIGLKVCLEAERGYNITFAGNPIGLTLPVVFAQFGIAITPLADGLRIGGAVELASPEAPPNFMRAEAMRRTLRRYLPALPETGGSEWMGRRPATPDSLPVIGRDPRDPRIVFAFGHGHLGLTLSAVTARHVAALVAGQGDETLSPFGIERFQ
ncbi:MAG: FAD-binding oxidoreductase [Bauldia sp.]|uniref:NAD(P)/FAD-dependent oxidoreductase n=1 Tax=Bauldia sp. TaxID=2575872 RepID=UPI001DC2593A|nr:FAD-binding oxidoreductase [Bauldia sp.]MCB1497246.1 FAD-binding oxidoreductase [Bauldia sp.]